MAVRYENAPILEALIDIRVELPPAVTTETLASLHPLVQERYPQRQERIDFEGRFSLKEDVAASSERRLVGYSFSSEDGKQILQARLDGFTFSRIKPYGTWLELRDESKRLWEIYRSATTPTRIVRIAVRYINQIDIPAELINYKDYFRTTPEVSPVLPQGLSGFFMQLHFPQEDFEGMVVLTQTRVSPRAAGTDSVVLDLDVFKLGAISAEDIWSLLETLRDRKNQFFEGSITDKTRELFGRKQEY
jgi:uncharacterized protein (TIGR04255 family)